jgi:hypothetical protein
MRLPTSGTPSGPATCAADVYMPISSARSGQPDLTRLLSHWLVTLTDGLVVDVWADSVERIARRDDQRDYRFCNLMDVPPDKQKEFEIVGETPTNRSRVVVTVARFARSSVMHIDMAEQLAIISGPRHEPACE